MAETATSPNNVAIKFRGRTERAMPLEQGSSKKTVSRNIEELHTGKTFAHTKKKFGKARANKQAVAIALNEARKSMSKRGKHQARRLARRGMISEKAAQKHLGE